MKPSEKIKEIQEKGGLELNLEGPATYYKKSEIEAIIDYLEEEYEKNRNKRVLCECDMCKYN
jgi:hypothetical protein